MQKHVSRARNLPQLRHLGKSLPTQSPIPPCTAKGSARLPKLNPGIISQPLITLSQGIARADSSRLLNNHERELAGHARLVKYSTKAGAKLAKVCGFLPNLLSSVLWLLPMRKTFSYFTLDTEILVLFWVPFCYHESTYNIVTLRRNPIIMLLSHNDQYGYS